MCCCEFVYFIWMNVTSLMSLLSFCNLGLLRKEVSLFVLEGEQEGDNWCQVSEAIYLTLKLSDHWSECVKPATDKTSTSKKNEFILLIKLILTSYLCQDHKAQFLKSKFNILASFIYIMLFSFVCFFFNKKKNRIKQVRQLTYIAIPSLKLTILFSQLCGHLSKVSPSAPSSGSWLTSWQCLPWALTLCVTVLP